MCTSMGFETPEPVVYHIFLLQLWKTHGRGTATLEEKAKAMTMTILRKTLSAAAVFLLFLVFDAKGEEEDLSIICSYFFLGL
jgi:hypothetical protein